MSDYSQKHNFVSKILVVDDEKRVRDGCIKVLSAEGYSVFSAPNGQEGIKMIEASHYDIVLLDLMMPGLSGFDVLRHVKSIHPETVLIVISGYATLEHSIEAMKKGAFDFIPKPFSAEQLRVTVSKAIDFTYALKDIATEKSRMRMLINHLTDGVLTTDTKKNVVLANPAFLSMSDCGCMSGVGKSVSQLTDNKKLHALIDECLSIPEGEFAELCEEIDDLNEKKKEEMVIGAKSLPFRDRTGRNIGTITMLRDITAANRINREKSDFVSMVSHEIRNPLGAVMAQLKLLSDGLVGEINAKQKEIIQRASLRLNALADMTTDLLDLAKIESGLLVMEKEELDMKALLDDLISFQQPGASQKNITLKLEAAPELPPVLANRQNMEELFSNLITNAIKYSREGTRIIITAKKEQDYLLISVADQGFGMSQEDQDCIFERFYRIKDAKRRMITGTGLGLSIVKRIIESHNGMIRLESEPDKGSTFHVYLPIHN
ncbi:response regulator [Desulfococcaceae bacterium HSG9]|nr:response regulator [Desulfococcaceae bacterium HSG9]